ncbi:MAG: hypothetical protein K6E47_14265 [Lachnospiraceae bacterium]|nr:hypothetical protein [Lachnospiraceae bacterium]
MFFIIVIILGVLYFASCASGSRKKEGMNFRLMFAAVICSFMIFVTAGKREEMTVLFVISSIGLWFAFAYDIHLKKLLSQNGQSIEDASKEYIDTSFHTYGIEKVFRDSQEVYGKTDSVQWLKNADTELRENQSDSVNIQIVKKYYIVGKNIYIQDSEQIERLADRNDYDIKT